jgi:hypothetical protein
MLTADTITDEQIISLRFDPSTTQLERQLCSVALGDFRVLPHGIRMGARARCAETINAREASKAVR